MTLNEFRDFMLEYCNLYETINKDKWLLCRYNLNVRCCIDNDDEMYMVEMFLFANGQSFSFNPFCVSPRYFSSFDACLDELKREFIEWVNAVQEGSGIRYTTKFTRTKEQFQYR